MEKLKAWWSHFRAVKFTEQDFENALANIGDAKDREDFIWKLRMKLLRK